MLQFLNGSAAELFVAAKFAERGYSILWPLTTQSRYDIVIEKNGVFQKVQVKKATASKTGPYTYLQARISGKNKLANTPYKPEDVDIFVFTDMDKLWVAPYSEVGHLTSVCLSSSNPKYKPQTKYNAKDWLL